MICGQGEGFRGLPPPAPRPGLLEFHVSIVSGNHPRVVPITASGSGSLYLPSVSGLTPILSATSDLERYLKGLASAVILTA